MDDHTNERFFAADFSGTSFRSVNFSHVTISNARLFDVEISGVVGRLSVNGIDVSAYVEAQLDERHPERRLLVPFDPDGMRIAWTTIEDFSAATLQRARALPVDVLDESVDGEWSFLETLRHLVFATDRWIIGPVLHDANPFHRLGMPNPPHAEQTARMWDVDATPTFDEVLAVRRERMSRVADCLDRIDTDELNRRVASPNGGPTTVASCLHIVFRDEWWHDQYANRDLAILERRQGLHLE